uniref:Uncharacterized protein n=1 Tax=Amazona collaria TaxID=241587 RepID=A0A8B9EXQ7_9PSIT
MRKRKESLKTLRKMYCLSYQKPTAQTRSQPVCKGSRRKPVIIPLTKKEAPGNPPSLLIGFKGCPRLLNHIESIQERSPTSAKNVRKPLAVPQTLPLTIKLTQERKLFPAPHAGKASVAVQLSSTIRKSIWMRSLLGNNELLLN